MVLLLLAVWSSKKKKKKEVVEKKRLESVKPVNEIEEAERENLLSYKVQGGVELDEVVESNIIIYRYKQKSSLYLYSCYDYKIIRLLDFLKFLCVFLLFVSIFNESINESEF